MLGGSKGFNGLQQLLTPTTSAHPITICRLQTLRMVTRNRRLILTKPPNGKFYRAFAKSIRSLIDHDNWYALCQKTRGILAVI